MAEVLRDNGELGGSHILNPPTEPRPEALPERSSPASNPAWNRSAEVVGRSLGTTVAEVKRLHLVGKNAGAATANVAGAAESEAARLHHAAETTLLELMEKMTAYDSVGTRTGQRMRQLRQTAWYRLQQLRSDGRQRLANLRDWKAERPEQVILACAVAAFALGAALRVWRLNRES